MGIYIGRLVVDPEIVAKLNVKHQITMLELCEAMQWPAEVQAALELSPVHGRRWIAVGSVATGREVIAVLLPTPEWEDMRADTWIVKTARWL